ncbi:IclR family transcriptional regulator [Halioxenophilus aromaticivorans]|uniref:HTH-type transcriptional repressor AllR n=1 Tax=Halioxenophilus aromaticivorans TaxID=1306992 RepID=A0AAV3U7V7_9ALTE
MSDYVIPNLSNACRILRLLVDTGKGLSRDEIADLINIPRSSTYRILQTLVTENFVEHRKRRYHPGAGLYTLGMQLSSVDRLRPLCRPVLHSLSQITGFTAHIAIPSGYQVLLLEVCDSPNLLRVASRAGAVAPIHVAATGKIFLSYLFADDLETIANEIGFARFTDRTLTSVEEVHKEINATLKRGYGMDEREYNDDVRCLATPLFDASGTVIAAIGVTSPISQFPKSDIQEVAKTVKEHALRCYKLLKGEEVGAV